MLSKKHYIAIANARKQTTETHNPHPVTSTNYEDSNPTQVINKDRFIFRLTQIFKNDNINFNYTRFENACKTQEEA